MTARYTISAAFQSRFACDGAAAGVYCTLCDTHGTRSLRRFLLSFF